MATIATRQTELKNPAISAPRANPELPDTDGKYRLWLGAKVYYVVRVHSDRDVEIQVVALGSENDLSGNLRSGWSHDGREFYGPTGWTSTAGAVIARGEAARDNQKLGQLMIGFSQSLYTPETAPLTLQLWHSVFAEPSADETVSTPLNPDMSKKLIRPKNPGYMYMMMNDSLDYTHRNGPRDGYSDNRGYLVIELAGVSTLT